MEKRIASPIARAIGGILALAALALGLFVAGSVSASAPITTRGLASIPVVTSTCTPEWRVIPNNFLPPGTFLGVDAVSADDAWMVGATGPTTDTEPLIAHWDGVRLNNVPIQSPGPGTQLRSISAVSPNDIWAVGDYGYDHMITLHWNGSNWALVPNPDPGGGAFNRLASVDAVSSNDVWAVGSYYTDQNHGVIMHWNGTQWSLVDESLLAPNLQFEGVSAASANEVWVVGAGFPGGLLASAMWHWDGSTWSDHSNINVHGLKSVAAVATDDAWAVGGTDIIHWNGSFWSIMPSQGRGSLMSSISAVSANDIWAAGTQFVLHWDGTQWSPSISGFAAWNDVSALAADDVWIVTGGPIVEHYSCDIPPTITPPTATRTPTPAGTSTSTPTPITCRPGWNAIGSYDLDAHGVTALSPDDVWAVGTAIERWNGAYWSLVPSPNVGTLYGVSAISAGDVWAVGYEGTPNGLQTLTMHWDGTAWSVVPSPDGGTYNALYSVVGIAADDVWAVGYYDNGDPPTHPLIEHWDGTAWTVVPGPEPAGGASSILRGVAAASANDVWAVGGYSVSGEPGHTLTMHWNGSVWTIVPSQDIGTLANGLSAVSAVAANDAWAAGLYRSGSGTNYTLVEHWNGATWSIVSSPNIGYWSILSGVSASSASNVWAVGYYVDSPYYDRTLILHWDGSAWSIAPSPNIGTLDNSLVAVAALPGGDAWAVGSYTLSGVHTLTLRYSPDCSTPTPGSPTATPTPGTPVSTAQPTNTPAPTGSPCSVSFTDVQPSDYFYQAVLYLYCEGAISGYADNTFRPYNNTTRGQLTKIVALAERWPLLNPPIPSFTDVLPGSPFYEYVETVFAHGVISGYSDGTFRPGNNVTRGQVAKIVVAAQHWTLLDPPTPTFSDVLPGSPFYPYVETAYAHGIITGYADGTFRPGTSATRGQIAKIVYSAIAVP